MSKERLLAFGQRGLKHFQNGTQDRVDQIFQVPAENYTNSDRWNLEMKNVWTPNINIPTIPLNKATYLAPPTPNELLKITGNGKPYFCEEFPTKFAKIATNNPAIKHDEKTMIIFKS